MYISKLYIQMGHSNYINLDYIALKYTSPCGPCLCQLQTLTFVVYQVTSTIKKCSQTLVYDFMV
jgi:hypothetical protein